jgi:hypothetical protein
MKVLILTPLGVTVHHRFCQSMAEAYRKLPYISWVSVPAVSDVAAARNHLTSVFMQSTADFAIWIDSDEDFSTLDIDAALAPLRAGESELCAVPYAQKKPGKVKWNFAFWPGEVEKQLGYTGPKLTLDSSVYVRARYAGTGFLAMTRAAVEKASQIVNCYEPFLSIKKADLVGGGVTHSKEKQFAIFEPRIIDGRRYGEDYGACHIFNKCGLDILLATVTTVGHFDGNIRYGEEFDLDDYARRSAAYYEESR